MTTSNQTKCLSLLKKLQDLENILVRRIKGSFQKIRESSNDRMEEVLIDNIDKVRTSRVIYSNRALIRNSKDQNVFDQVDSLSDKELVNVLKDRKLYLPNYESYSDGSDTATFPLVPYAGGKQGINKSIIQNTLIESFKMKKYKSVVDVFGGAGGFTYSALPVLIDNDVEYIEFNDINRSMINLHRQVQKNHKQVQRHLASIAIDFFKENGKFLPTTREEARTLAEKLLEEVHELELNRKMNPRRAALYMYLMHHSTGGMIDYDIVKKTTDFELSYKAINIDRLINKVEIFHNIYNIIEMKFRSVNYETVLKKYKNDKEALLLIDSPYLEYSPEKETKKDSAFTYGMKFNHKGLLNKLRRVRHDFIYFNNHNLLIENYAKQYNYDYIVKEREYQNNSDNGSVNTITEEIRMLKLPKIEDFILEGYVKNINKFYEEEKIA